MGGLLKISTNYVTRKAPLFHYSRLKMEIASEASPKLSGQLLSLVNLLVTTTLSCSTSLVLVCSLVKKQEKIYGARIITVLISVKTN